MLRSCLGLSSSSKITIPISFSSTKRRISSSLPLPTKVTEWGWSRRWVKRRTARTPAVEERKSSSSRYSRACSSFWFLVMSPTRTASSLLASVMINSLILYKNTIIYKEFAQRYIAVSESSVLGALRPLALHSLSYAGDTSQSVCASLHEKDPSPAQEKGLLELRKTCQIIGNTLIYVPGLIIYVRGR